MICSIYCGHGCLSFVSVVRSLRRADHPSRGALPSVVCLSVILKALFTFHNDALNYKITVILKQLKFRRSFRHISVHAGTIIREPLLCLAKTTVVVQQVGMVPWHWPRHKRRGYWTTTVVLAKHKSGPLMMVPTWTETCWSERRNFNCFNIPVIL
jgi:hypothetical protein